MRNPASDATNRNYTCSRWPICGWYPGNCFGTGLLWTLIRVCVRMCVLPGICVCTWHENREYGIVRFDVASVSTYTLYATQSRYHHISITCTPTITLTTHSPPSLVCVCLCWCACVCVGMSSLRVRTLFARTGGVTSTHSHQHKCTYVYAYVY